MEHTKRLIIVTPISETVQKLHDVLTEIVEDEKIDITKVDEGRELNRLISLGQSLVIFSSAKSCALFLQEYKTHIFKFHSKIILLAPKEIPGKTLAKFLKAGLTEVILESSPPKTILHKVRIHLRSIKSGTIEAEADDKDQIVKNNMIDLSKISDALNELSSHKSMASHDDQSSLNHLKKGAGSENHKGELKGHYTFTPEESRSNWNSRRHSNSWQDKDNGGTFFDNKRKKNIYYPFKKGIDTSLETISKDIAKRKKLREANSNNLSLTKIKDGFSPDSGNKKRSREENGNERNISEANESSAETMDYGLGKKNTRREYNEGEENPATDGAEWEEEVYSAKNKLRKMLEDIEIAENELNEITADSETEEKAAKAQEEDAGYRIEKKLPQKKDRAESPWEDDHQENAEDEDLVKRNTFKKKSRSETGAEEEEGNEILSSLEENVKKQKASKRNSVEEERGQKKKNPDEESAAAFKNEKKSYRVVDDEESKSKKAIAENELDNKKEKQDDILIDMSGLNKEKKSYDDDAGAGDDDNKSSGQDDLESINKDGLTKNKDENNDGTDEDSDKSDQDGQSNDKTTNDKSNSGKGNDLDHSLKDDDRKKNPYSWGNLVDKNKSTSIDVSKNPRPKFDLGFSYPAKTFSDQIIDYHKIKKEFDRPAPIEEVVVEEPLPEEIVKEALIPEEVIPKKVIEIDVRGIEFSIFIVKLIYNKETIDRDYFDAISNEFISQYKAYAVFYTYETSKDTHQETFNTFTFYDHLKVSSDRKESWEREKNASSFESYFSKTMPTWQCTEIEDKTNTGKFWESSELPRWGGIELANKKMELIFPYFDGTDLMGTALIFFPEGVDASKEKSIMLTLDTARTVFLNTIQRKNNDFGSGPKETSVLEKIKKVFSFVSRFFNRKKEDDQEREDS